MSSDPAPFLKWAGGKGALSPTIVARIPPGARRYHEPFVGGGAVFFAARAARPLLGAALSDGNPGLITCYAVVRDCLPALQAALAGHEQAYLSADAAGRASYYYAVRASEPAGPVERAARLIFLNRTAYNGLYRENASGRFNVPHGRYRNPRILDLPRLEAAAAALRGTVLTAGDFADACAAADRGDFVYLDPPYQPLNATSRFTAYTARDFGPADQERLAAAFEDLSNRGVRAVLSNSDHPAIHALYADRGYRIDVVAMSRAINSRGDRRDPVPELLIDNEPRLAGDGRRRGGN